MRRMNGEDTAQQVKVKKQPKHFENMVSIDYAALNGKYI